MSRIAALLACWFVLGLELGLRHVFAVEFGSPPLTITPSLSVPLLAFFCLHASAHSAIWACVLCGVVMDLLWWPGASSGPPGAVLGLYGIGYAISAWCIVRVRSLLIRKSPLTLVVLSVAFAMIAQTWIVLIMGLRTFYDPVEWELGREFVGRIMSAGLTGAAGLAAWIVLTPLTGLFGFHQPVSRFGPGRGY